MRPETKERILAAIDELEYQPNQAARQLKTGHAPIIGLIVPSVATPFYGLFARHVEEAALKRGYQVLFGNSGRDPEPRAFLCRRVVGLWSARHHLWFIVGQFLPFARPHPTRDACGRL